LPRFLWFTVYKSIVSVSAVAYYVLFGSFKHQNSIVPWC